MDASRRELSIVVPTYNERENVAVFLDRLRDALTGIDWEVLFVDDDSPDGTLDAIRAYARAEPRVRWISRVGRRGLSSACIDGMDAAQAPVVAVMDADLQHDEGTLAPMLRAVQNDGLDLVVASRYADGGELGDWAWHRRLASRAATLLTRVATPVRLSDPMSGFFMLRADLFAEVAPRLSGRGFKILLDILMSATHPLAVREIPFAFRPRHAGTSKLGLGVILDLLLLLLEKRFFKKRALPGPGKKALPPEG